MRTWILGALEVACTTAIAVGAALTSSLGVGLIVGGVLDLGLLFVAQLPAPSMSQPETVEPATEATA